MDQLLEGKRRQRFVKRSFSCLRWGKTCFNALMALTMVVSIARPLINRGKTMPLSRNLNAGG
jgi:hypothetical protein